MRAKTTRRIAEVLIATGTALLALASVQSQLDDALGLPSAAYVGIAVAGAAALGAGALLIAGSYVALPRRADYLLLTARPGQLPLLRRFAGALIDAPLLTVQGLAEWQKQRPDCHQLVFRRTRRGFRQSRELVGFFSIVPITAEAQREIEKSEQRRFRVEGRHIVRKGGRPAAIYLAAVGASGLRAEGETLRLLQGFLKAWTTEASKVYTRPVTKDGLRLARKHGFKPISRNLPPRETMFVKDYSRA